MINIRSKKTIKKEKRKMNNWYEIENLSEFLFQITKLSRDKFIEINDNLKESDNEIDLSPASGADDTIITKEEAENIILPMLEADDNGKYMVCDELLFEIIQNLNSRMVSNSLSKLVSLGIVESAFDDKLNDFVFWIKE